MDDTNHSEPNRKPSSRSSVVWSRTVNIERPFQHVVGCQSQNDNIDPAHSGMPQKKEKAMKKKQPKPTPMRIPDPLRKRYTFNFVVPPSDQPTHVFAEFELYREDEKGNLYQIETLLGDGLIAPDKIAYQGFEYTLPPLPWKLVYLLTNELTKRLPMNKVISTLWPDGNGDEEKLASVKTAANRVLINMSDYGTVKFKDGWVILEWGIETD